MRFLLSVVIAVTVTLTLFLLMHALISGTPDIVDRPATPVSLDVSAAPREEPDRDDARRRPPAPAPSRLPPPPAIDAPQPDAPRPGMPDIAAPTVRVQLEPGSGPSVADWASPARPPDTDVVPVFTVPPEYPRDAVLEGLGGWVDLEFTIDADGGVSDVTVVDATPARVFDRNAQRALASWRFLPRVVDGEAVARRARIRIEFDVSN